MKSLTKGMTVAMMLGVTTVSPGAYAGIGFGGSISSTIPTINVIEPPSTTASPTGVDSGSVLEGGPIILGPVIDIDPPIPSEPAPDSDIEEGAFEMLPAPLEGTLCRSRSGAVSMRDGCKKSQKPVSPPDLHVCATRSGTLGVRAGECGRNEKPVDALGVTQLPVVQCVMAPCGPFPSEDLPGSDVGSGEYPVLTGDWEDVYRYLRLAWALGGTAGRLDASYTCPVSTGVCFCDKGIPDDCEKMRKEKCKDGAEPYCEPGKSTCMCVKKKEASPEKDLF